MNLMRTWLTSTLGELDTHLDEADAIEFSDRLETWTGCAT